jgi:lysophospholipase L1-like esterase
MKRLPNRRAVLCLAGLLMAASLGLNGWLILKVLDYKGRLLLAREFPDDDALNVPKDSRAVIWMAGDSRIAAWVFPDTRSRRVVNRGVNGFTARETLDRYRADLAAGSRPDVTVIQAGINDVASAGYNRPSRLPPSAFTGWPDRPGPDRIMEQCAADMRLLVRAATDAGSRVVLLTVFPPGPLELRDLFFWSEELDARVAGLNESLRSLVGPAVTVLDAATLLSDGARTKNEYSLDTLHLNAAGYAVLTNALEAALSGTGQAATPRRQVLTSGLD